MIAIRFFSLLYGTLLTVEAIMEKYSLLIPSAAGDATQ